MSTPFIPYKGPPPAKPRPPYHRGTRKAPIVANASTNVDDVVLPGGRSEGPIHDHGDWS
ncbi:hypothetical protein LTS18_014897, partial [Coniosporium uncinatum]